MKTALQAFLIFIVLTVLTGLVYPFLITAVAQLAMPYQANGSFVIEKGLTNGSYLIGQMVTNDSYFHCRPSAVDNCGSNSGGFNYGPASSNQVIMVSNRILDVRAKYGLTNGAAIPPDMVLASGSGLDPDISVPNAMLQARLVAQKRGLKFEELALLINKLADRPVFGFWGTEKVNVLKLNMALDGLK